MKLRHFQHRFLTAATAPGTDTAVLSTPRGNGKSWIAGYLVARILDPADPLFRPGTESVLCAASIEQARIVFRFARGMLGEDGYRYLDSATRAGITHTSTRTRLRVIGSNGKTAMGLVNCPWAICDEPGSWEVNGGTLLRDAIEGAKGKPGSPLRSLYIGTLAPATGGWWHDMVEAGSYRSTIVHALQGDPTRWAHWREIQRVNPLTSISDDFRAKLLEERDAARRDPRLKAAFLSYRLNVPTGDESTMLLGVDDWKRVTARPVPDRAGRPIVAVDLGAGRAWSAAVAVWKSGRVESMAVAPGIPNLDEQEKRDVVPRGTYRMLAESGALTVAAGLRVQPAKLLIQAALDSWGTPDTVLCDRFRLADLQDAVAGRCPVFPRRTMWSTASEDIRALRKLSLDGPLSCAVSSRALVAASLAAAMVKNDESGNTRLVKRGAKNQARDDVAAALVLAAGSFARALARSRPARGFRTYAA